MRLAEININPLFGLEKTLQIMRDMEIESVNNYTFKNFITNNFGALRYNKTKLFYSLWYFVHNAFTYKTDQGDETLIAPKYMVTIRKGDCDDFALFIKSALHVLGIKSYYLLAGKDNNGFTHIAVVTPCGIILDGVSNQFNYLSDEYINRQII